MPRREKPPKQGLQLPHPRVAAQCDDWQSGPGLWRIIWPFRALEAQGYYAKYAPGAHPGLTAACVPAEAFILARIYWRPWHLGGGAAMVAQMHDQGRAVIVEMDDDLLSPACLPQVLLMSKGKTPEEVDLERTSRLRSLALCDGMTASTEYLAAVARSYTDRPVVVAPNAIDCAYWDAMLADCPRDDPRLTVGWCGGNRLPHDTAALAAAWERVARRYPHVAFRVAGYHDPQLCAAVPADQLVKVDWEPIDTYGVAYSNIDIGCAPLADLPFNWSKSPIKAYEYAAVGAAVIGSPIVYGGVLEAPKYGLTAQSAAEWEDALELLITDAPLRTTLRTRWAKRVRERYSLSVSLHHWLDGWSAIIHDFRRRQARLRAAPPLAEVPR